MTLEAATFVRSDCALALTRHSAMAEMARALLAPFGRGFNLAVIASLRVGRVGRIVTVFKLPMSDDRRNGVRISTEEYLEMFVVRPGTVTVQIRVDRGGYWLLRRETLMTVVGKAASLPAGALLKGPSFEGVRLQLQTQIDATRYILQSTF